MQIQHTIFHLYAYFLSLFLLMACAGFLQAMLPADIPPAKNIKALFILSGTLFPEFKERSLFISLIVLLQPLNFVAIKLVSWLKFREFKLLKNSVIQTMLVLAIPVLLILPIYWDVLLLITGSIQSYWQSACLTVLLATSVFFSAFALPVLNQLHSVLAHRLTTYCLRVIVAIAVLISVLSFRVQSVFLVNENANWIDSFEAVFYSVSQTVAGKTLLADLPAQYGLYAEILKPIFSLIGLSVLSFTTVLSVLQMVSLFAVFWIYWHLIKNNVLRLFSAISLCLVAGGTWMLRMNSDSVDQCYQYWPLRFLFPTLSLCAFYTLLKRGQNYTAIALMALFSGVAITWNLDSGIPVFGAFMAYLVLQLVFPIHSSRLLSLKKLLLALVVVIIWLVSFGVYLQAKTDQIIHWQDLIKYQRLFYQAGFAMLPIPTPTLSTLLALDPWLAVVSVYIFAITGALSKRIQREQALVWDVLFFIAILGLGLFAYYQGRSHILVLTAVVWPAMSIAFILTDRTLRAIQARVLPFVFAATLLPMLLLGLLLTAAFIDDLPILLSEAQSNSQALLQATKTPVTENIAFIHRYTINTNKAAIISRNQAVYFAETGLISAVNGPGIGETILVADREQFFNQLFTKPVEYLFVQQTLLSKERYAKLLQHYQVKARSKYGMVFLSGRASRTTIRKTV